MDEDKAGKDGDDCSESVFRAALISATLHILEQHAFFYLSLNKCIYVLKYIYFICAYINCMCRMSEQGFKEKYNLISLYVYACCSNDRILIFGLSTSFKL